VKRFLSLFLTLVVAVGICLSAPMTIDASAAISTDYLYWAQDDSSKPWYSLSIASDKHASCTFGKYGCWIMSYNKMIIQCGSKKQETFTPVEMLNWVHSNGLTDVQGNLVAGHQKKIAAAFSLEYVGQEACSSYDVANSKILNYAAKGNYYIIVRLNGHSVVVDNERTNVNGYATISNSWTNSNYNVPLTNMQSKYSVKFIDVFKVKSQPTKYAEENKKYQEKYDFGLPLDGSLSFSYADGTQVKFGSGARLPGLDKDGGNMVPQGLGYNHKYNIFLVSGYNKTTEKDGDKTAVYALDFETCEAIVKYNLYWKDKRLSGHVGGVASSGKNVYVANGQYIYRFVIKEDPRSVDSGSAGITAKKLVSTERYNVGKYMNKASCSYVTITNNVLWTGNFYDDKNYDKKASLNNNSLILGFKLSGSGNDSEWTKFTEKSPDYKIKVPNSIENIQCATVASGKLFISQSYGRTKNSKLLVAPVTLKSTTTFDKKKVTSTTAMPMMEGFFIKGNWAFVVFESAASYYADGLDGKGKSKNPTDVIWAVPLFPESGEGGWEAELMYTTPPVENTFKVSPYEFLYKLNADGKSYAITGVKPFATGKLVIPQKYNSLSVTKIASNSMQAVTFVTNITEIVIPEGNLKEIEEHAFFGYLGRKVVIEGNVEKWGGWAFSGSPLLTEVVVKEGVTSFGRGAFDQCMSLEKVQLPSTLKTIPAAAFEECEKLSTITIPEGVEKIEPRAFAGCTSLKSIKLPNSLKEIEGGSDAGAFECCGKLSKVTFGNAITKIGDRTFLGTGLTSINFPTSLKEIGSKAFCCCEKLPCVTIPSTVTRIGKYAFDSSEMDWPTYPGFRIYGARGSEAERYANSENIPFGNPPTSLSTPKLSIKNTSSGIKVSWSGGEGAEKYKVYRSTYNPNTKKWSGWKSVKETTVKSVTDKTVKLGTKYIYTVRAFYGDVKSGINSTDSLKYNVTPTVKVAVVNNGIKVSWSTAANATGYTVYRSEYNTKTKKWGSWKSQGTTKATTKSWTDKKAKSGTKYKYTVRACNGSFKSSYKASSSVKR